MLIERAWAIPSAWTFTIKPIANLLRQEMTEGIWIDPFAGRNSPATITNDLIEKADFKMDALEFLKSRKDNEADGILLDPPYSFRQVSEHYKRAGIKITGWHTSFGWSSAIKNEAARIIKPGGKVICFGWNTMGLGKNRGFKMERVLIVPHGGQRNDTLVTVEYKII